jgi:MAP3K TRAFs-binding domain
MREVEESKMKLCFVAMGFGKKTDFETQRVFDLDQTYEEIIKPAVEDAGLRCIRADAIGHSGLIDVKMYEMLLRADLVVADISTANPNAIYELGVRHALRPYSTILIKEDSGRFHFDLNHLATLTYRHLGDEIGAKEARNKSAALRSLIEEVIQNPTADSPVYTFLPGLAQPKFSDEAFERLLNHTEEASEKLSDIIDRAKAAASSSNHLDAEKLFRLAASMTADNTYLIQQQALHRYKSALPSEFVALTEGRAILEALNPNESRDSETLGIAGAIYKNLWNIVGDPSLLNQAIGYYRTGYGLRGDYYTGVNLALLLEKRSETQSDADEKIFDQMSARKTRESLIASLQSIVSGDDFSERSDRMWIYGTLSDCYLALGLKEESLHFERLFTSENPAEWEVKSFQEARTMMLEYKSNLNN